MKRKKTGRPLLGSKPKEVFSIRLDLKVYKEIIKKWGGLTSFINECIEEKICKKNK